MKYEIAIFDGWYYYSINLIVFHLKLEIYMVQLGCRSFSVLFLPEVKSQKLNVQKLEWRYQQSIRTQELGSGIERDDETNFLAAANHQSIHGRENWILLKLRESDDVISNTHGIRVLQQNLFHWNLKKIRLSQFILLCLLCMHIILYITYFFSFFKSCFFDLIFLF